MPRKMITLEDEFRGDEATIQWLKSMSVKSKTTYKCLWKYFLKFTGLTGNEILESRKADKEYAWEKKVLAFKNWVIEQGKSETSATTAASVVRGFFSFYRLTLKFRRSESARLNVARRKYEDYRFSIEDLKRMFDIANLQGRYIVTAGKSFGLRAGDFLRLTRGDLEPYIERKEPISIGEYSTEKEGVPAFPFIDVDAQPVIKLMIEKMDREGETNVNDRILKFKNPIELTRNLRRLAEEAGLKTGKKVVRFHCLRKFLTDRLSSFTSESKWKQIVGKKIPEKAYISPDLLREDYERAMKQTCFPEAISEEERRIENVVNTARSIGVPEDQIQEKLKERGKTWNTAREFARIVYRMKATQRNETQVNGGGSTTNDCPTFKEINESELLSHLQRGWSIVHTNSQNEKVIIRRG